MAARLATGEPAAVAAMAEPERLGSRVPIPVPRVTTAPPAALAAAAAQVEAVESFQATAALAASQATVAPEVRAVPVRQVSTARTRENPGVTVGPAVPAQPEELVAMEVSQVLPKVSDFKVKTAPEETAAREARQVWPGMAATVQMEMRLPLTAEPAGTEATLACWQARADWVARVREMPRTEQTARTEL
jgi:hypothetical protein